MLVIPIRQPAERNLISNNLQVLILPDTTEFSDKSVLTSYFSTSKKRKTDRCFAKWGKFCKGGSDAKRGIYAKHLSGKF